jgi:hypothetical protein
MNNHLAPVPFEKSYRLINHDPTVPVSARQAGVDDVMAVARWWVHGPIRACSATGQALEVKEWE